MKRTTITLSDDLLTRVRLEADRRRASVSQIVRETLAAKYGAGAPRRISFIGIGDSGDPTLASRFDEILAAERAADPEYDLSR
ncbi:MAG: ribbon-helix-helix protein, CopG family [Chloroflexota bacterium]|nr:MAG: ribbon-helix-helix protein, CopG family [Chloroflexota bacterium]